MLITKQSQKFHTKDNMLKLFLTKDIKKWLDANMSQYLVANTQKNVTTRYKATTKQNESFDITIYSTGLITINGSLQKRIYTSLFSQIKEVNYSGADEVGVGDFFGPVVYVTVSLDDTSIQQLSKLYLPINDSKKLTTAEIFTIFSATKDIVTYSANIKYDSQINGLNSIAQKVVFHHQNITDQTNTLVVDLFTTEKSFYKYSKEHNVNWPSKLILETKADSKYYSVALASIFARAIFLQEMEKLNDKYLINFPLGATNVKPCAAKFIETYSKEELATFCKTSFKTFNEV